MLSLGAAPFYLLNVAHASNGQGGGFLPLLVIALSLLALAITERSVMLGVVGVAYTGLALLANLYDVENQLSNLG
ncbi:MAG: hypothetical protein DLM54_03620 [Acidimicrobiales bacterium]|nr:MAG: hypothetical protein DLM54_03620 [Acidimicrobiales bacterium]